MTTHAPSDSSDAPTVAENTVVKAPLKTWGVAIGLAVAAALWYARMEYRVDAQSERIDRHVGDARVHRDPDIAVKEAEARGALNETLSQIKVQLTSVEAKVESIRTEMNERRRHP